MKYLFLLLVAGGAIFLMLGTQIKNENALKQNEAARLARKTAGLKKELATLQQYSGEPTKPVLDNWQTLRNYVNNYASSREMESAVKVNRQKDYDPADKYVQASDIPGVKKLEVRVYVKTQKNNWQLAALVKELFQRFPVALNPVVYVNQGQKTEESPLTIYQIQDGSTVLEGVITLYGV